MGKGGVYPFFSNYLLVTSICIEKGAVDKMTSHFITAPFLLSGNKGGKENVKERYD